MSVKNRVILNALGFGEKIDSPDATTRRSDVDLQDGIAVRDARRAALQGPAGRVSVSGRAENIVFHCGRARYRIEGPARRFRCRQQRTPPAPHCIGGADNPK
ncbi:MAG: hypothetical protein ABL916_16025 [Burkholderiaceae bacterium]